MATYYVDCTISGGVGAQTGVGSEVAPWTNVKASYANITAADTLILITNKSNPFTNINMHPKKSPLNITL